MMKKETTQKPFVSIITATYNTEHSLGKTIESIRRQNFKDFEWIVVDGGSEDLTLEIIKRNGDVIANWISEPDGGIYDAWNKGLDLARGEWIAFLGAGDCYFPDALSCYYDEIQSGGPEIEFISSKIQLVNYNEAVLREIGKKFDFLKHKKFMGIAHVGAFHKNTLFAKFGKFDIGYKSAGDYEYFMRCGSSLRSAFLDKITVTMSIGGVSNGFHAIGEAYKIQKRYGLSAPIAISRACLALLKRLLRLYIRGY